MKNNFYVRLKEARQQKGLTQKELANILNMQSAAISKYETGYSYPNIEVLALLCETLGVSADYLIGITDNPHPSLVANHYDELTKKIGSLPENLKYEAIGYINALSSRK